MRNVSWAICNFAMSGSPDYVSTCQFSPLFLVESCGASTTLAKKIETGTQAKHRRVHAREITHLRHVRAVVSIFLAKVVVGAALSEWTVAAIFHTVGPCKKAVFACLATGVEQETFTCLGNILESTGTSFDISYDCTNRLPSFYSSLTVYHPFGISRWWLSMSMQEYQSFVECFALRTTRWAFWFVLVVFSFFILFLDEALEASSCFFFFFLFFFFIIDGQVLLWHAIKVVLWYQRGSAFCRLWIQLRIDDPESLHVFSEFRTARFFRLRIRFNTFSTFSTVKSMRRLNPYSDTVSFVSTGLNT